MAQKNQPAVAHEKQKIANELASSLEAIGRSEQEFRNGQGIDAHEGIKQVAKKLGLTLES